MSKKMKYVASRFAAAVLSLILVFGMSLCAFAEEIEVAEGTGTERTADSEQLVSDVAPGLGLNNVTLNNTDVLDNLTGPNRLFYNGDFIGKFVVNTEPYLDIYTEASAESEVAGKIYPASYGTIEEWGSQWTRISSGNVTGYISTREIFIGYDAEMKAKEVGHHKATVNVESVNIREEANPDSAVVATAIQSESFPVVETGDAWVRIDYGSGEGFVAKEYVDESLQLDEALSVEEEAAREVVASVAETQAAEAAEAAEAIEADAPGSAYGAQPNPGYTSSPPLSVSADEAYLLACMVYVESGGEPYEGQLAVANVILNRVRSPRFGGTTIAEVIYAAGQFPGATNGVLDRVLASGPSDSCVQAAQEALAGVNNIGDYCYFNGYVDTSSVASYTVIGGHTFYTY